MKLGAFSVSLSVKDIHASKAFYEKMGFTEFHGNIEQNWLIMKNDHVVIGLFQGMFEGNILTFNPGWDQNAQNIEDFTDIRDIQAAFKNNGLEMVKEIAEGDSGPANFTMIDPDGNAILVDQHV